MTTAEKQALVNTITKRLGDEGKLIEAGWEALRLIAIPEDAPAVQIHEMRMAYMAGAQHLFSCLMAIQDPGEEPTEDDIRRMDLIDAELQNFRKELELWAARTEPYGKARSAILKPEM